MNKVLLCYEDFAEMQTTQTILKKVGFDVFASSSEFSLAEQVLSFRPEITIGCGSGPRVSTIGVGRRLKEMTRWQGKAILIFPAGVRPDPLDLMRVRMDMALEAPLDMTRLLQILASFTNQDPSVLLERMVRAVSAPDEASADSDAGMISGGERQKSDRVFVSGSHTPEAKFVLSGHGQSTSSGSPNSSSTSFAKTPTFHISGNQSSVPGSTKEQPSSKNLPGTPPPLTTRTTGDSQSESHNNIQSGEAEIRENSVPIAGDGSSSADSQGRSSGASEAPSITAPPRNYAKFLENPIDTSQSNLTRKATKSAQKKLKADWSDSELKSQDSLRQEFTGALFQKKKN